MEERVFSQPEIKKALSRFVCVRLDGRESQDSAQLKIEYGPVVPGNVQNRIVSPTGENLAALPTHLNTQDLAAYLNEWADRYPGENVSYTNESPMPYFSTVHQALNISACDARPLVIVVSDNNETKARLETMAKPLAWSDEFSGRFHFAQSDLENSTLEQLNGMKTPAENGVYIVEPDQFGMAGKVLYHARVDDPADKAISFATSALADFGKSFESQTLVNKFQRHTEEGARDWHYI